MGFFVADWSLDDDFQNLTLTSSSNLKRIGNERDNIITGNNGSNTIDGGLGLDTPTGASGVDVFVFSTRLAASNVDHITDFVSGADKIQLSKSLVSAIGPSLSKSEFLIVSSGNAAKDSDDRLIYNKTDGSLWYDANAKAAGGSVQIAVLDGSPDNVKFSDFLIV